MYKRVGIWGFVSILALTSSCLRFSPGGDSDAPGVAIIKLSQAPEDAACLLITIDSQDSSIEHLLDLTPGQDTVFGLNEIPLGENTFTGYAYAEECDLVEEESVPTWLSDSVTVTISSNVTAEVLLIMRRNEITEDGTALVTVDFQEDDPNPGVKTVAEFPPMNGYTVRNVEGFHRLDSDPNVMIVAVENEGANCGSGTPVMIWRVTLDPVTGVATSLTQQQTLNQIQNTRGAMFESSDGTLFVGSGWCGFKPPYYSTDQGLTWTPATNGTYPPNSTFSYIEFKDNVYVATGYEPYHAQVYRWLGNGSWEMVFDMPPPRSMPYSMVEFQDKVFIAALIYWNESVPCEGTVAAYVSQDMINFQPTNGIGGCESVYDLVVSEDKLFAFTNLVRSSPETKYTYLWDTDSESWTLLGERPGIRSVTAHEGVLYGRLSNPDDPSNPRGIYRSIDGIDWQLLEPVDDILLYSKIEHDTLYFGTRANDNGVGYIYAIDL